jgi:hypothetical protein
MVEDPSAGDGASNHEKSDAHAVSLFKVGAYLLLLIALTFAAMFGLLKVMEQHAPPVTTQQSALHKDAVLPPEPRLQALPTADMEAYKLWEDSVLTSYTWVDRGSGLVRVPIDTAIRMVAAKGLPYDSGLVKQQGY